ncbi:hypothetical protein BDV12DRAFT_176393 [Aspergillus spectabilis]
MSCSGINTATCSIACLYQQSALLSIKPKTKSSTTQPNKQPNTVLQRLNQNHTMHMSIALNLLLTALAVTPTLAGQKVSAIWSAGNFNTVSGPGGSGTAGHDSGFNLLREDGKPIYNSRYPDGYNPCTHVGTAFTLRSGCLNGAEYKFRSRPLGCQRSARCLMDVVAA